MKAKAISISTLSLLLFFVGCEDQEIPQINNEQIADDTVAIESISYLALGDSYTIGQGVDTAFRWPNQLVDSLSVYDFELSKFRIIAQTGWTTTNLLDALEGASLEGFNMVSLLIGVNNQFQRKPFDLYIAELDSLLERSIEIAGDTNRVFMLSIPDYGVTPFGSSNSELIAEELDLYNEYAKYRCDALGIPFINITEISRELGDSEGALASDNLHPSGSQYSLWIEEVLPSVLSILE